MNIEVKIKGLTGINTELDYSVCLCVGSAGEFYTSFTNKTSDRDIKIYYTVAVLEN